MNRSAPVEFDLQMMGTEITAEVAVKVRGSSRMRKTRSVWLVAKNKVNGCRDIEKGAYEGEYEQVRTVEEERMVIGTEFEGGADRGEGGGQDRVPLFLIYLQMWRWVSGNGAACRAVGSITKFVEDAVDVVDDVVYLVGNAMDMRR
ncbi:hypothetical protein EDC04DRAFT_2606691 [Pisolithus marmoratus]|nr:hypothetical protein EDC04DRAFT_2606691 [Pisolithus marmoratus]